MAKFNRFTFLSVLENLADGMRYFALPVPAPITKKLGTKAAVPVKARVNGSKEFKAALRKAKLTKAFGLIPPSEKSFLLRKLEQAAKAETKSKRLDAILASARKRLE